MLLCIWHLRNAGGREGKRGEETKSEQEEEDGQGRNLHSEAQIDAKQLLNSCKVEQLLGRRGERDGEMKGWTIKGETDREGGPGEMLKYQTK